jgi:thiol-disulfide isomerase/thioredoxin
MLRKTLAIGLILGVASATMGQAEEWQTEQEAVKPLRLGDEAPALQIAKWVKGEPITEFESGKVYVVEFWATWCGPCIGGMPHVSELQEKYKDEGVRIIGVNIWDEPAKVAPFMEERKGRDGSVLPSGDELMEYTVAIEEKEEDGETGKMAKAWMEAAGQGGIPSAFIVDKESRIAWIGHPMQMDKPLEEVVAGTWDIDKEIARAEKQAQVLQQAEPLILAYQQAIETGDASAQVQAIDDLLAHDETMFAGLKHKKLEILLTEQQKYEEGYALAQELIEGDFKDNAQALNGIAWIILTAPSIQERNEELALRAALRASELTKHENPSVLDTLAKAYFESGDVERAIQTQELAVQKAAGQPEMLAELQARLEEYRAAKNKG